jgi:hypothetical protein
MHAQQAQRLCGICRQPGHNRQTCPRRPQHVQPAMPFQMGMRMGGQIGMGLGTTATTGITCKNCANGRGCRWAGRPGHI